MSDTPVSAQQTLLVDVINPELHNEMVVARFQAANCLAVAGVSGIWAVGKTDDLAGLLGVEPHQIVEQDEFEVPLDLRDAVRSIYRLAERLI